MITFTIPGEPQGKARARTFIHNKTGNFTTLTPEKTVLYENLIKQCAYSKMTDAGDFWTSEALQMDIRAYYKIPKSASLKKYADMHRGAIRPTKKPDADNVLKVVEDALNGVLYHDDTQIVRATVEKWYSDEPRVEVEIREV